MKIIDGIIKEPLGGAHRDPTQVAENMKTVMAKDLASLKAVPVDDLLEKRYAKFRSIGVFKE